MARLPRLVVPGLMHLGLQRALPGRPLCADATDRDALLAALHEAAANHRVALHAWAVQDAELLWMATPADAAGLSLFVQDLGRRYVSAYNRRHGRAGTVWDGRFRCGVLEPGAAVLDALLLVDGHAGAAGAAGGPGAAGAVGASGATSAAQRSGGRRDARLADPPEYWQLGNTPFEREAAYRERLAQGVSPGRAQALRAAAAGGWALGSAGFVAGLEARLGRRVAPRPRGRPPARV